MLTSSPSRRSACGERRTPPTQMGFIICAQAWFAYVGLTMGSRLVLQSCNAWLLHTHTRIRQVCVSSDGGLRENPTAAPGVLFRTSTIPFTPQARMGLGSYRRGRQAPKGPALGHSLPAYGAQGRSALSHSPHMHVESTSHRGGGGFLSPSPFLGFLSLVSLSSTRECTHASACLVV